MKNFYKYGFWVLLLSSLTLFNFWRITKSGFNNEIKTHKTINENRIFSLNESNAIINRQVGLVSGTNIISEEINHDIFKKSTLAILLDKFRCGTCQDKELVRLNGLMTRMKLIGIKIIGITTKERKIDVALSTKTLHIDFPIYHIDNYIFEEVISFTNEFPQLVVVKDDIIVCGFIPIPKDDNFSEMFYSHLLRKLE